jgi:SAM-dependent methyltransferase
MASPVDRFRAMLGALRGKPYYTAPASYWDGRHNRFRASLRGVGAVGLDERGNEADYEVKWEHLRPALEGARDAGSETLFDAGCGIGYFTARAHALGFRIEALDFSESAVELARIALPDDIVYHVASVSDFQSERQFDVVMCIDVLFHIVSDALWADAVSSLAALTSRTGRLIIQDHLVARAEKAAEDLTGRSHTRWRSRADYERALSGMQLEAIDTYTIPNEHGTKDLMVFRPRR